MGQRQPTFGLGLFFLVVVTTTTKTTTTAFVPPQSKRCWPSSSSSSLYYKQGTEAEKDVQATPNVSAAPLQDGEAPASSSLFTPWPSARVTSQGDYVQDLYLEDLIGGPLYKLQGSKLPALPLCNVDETLQRLLPTVLPLAKNNAERLDFLQAVQKFAVQAQPLQQLLQERYQQAMNNHTSWLQSLWQPLVYLQYRDPLPQFVSYFLLIPDDDKIMTTNNKNNKANDASVGLQRAAAALYAMAESRQAICSGQMAADTMAGEVPLCSAGFKYLWHACRVPRPHQDAYHLYDPARYQHAIIANRGQFFAVDMVDHQSSSDESPLPLPVLEARLRYCQTLASKQQRQYDYPQVGWVTSFDRDAWTDLRQEWIQNPKLAAALARLESGAFLLALDDESPETLTQACTEFWHGGKASGGNRWFDKSMQLLVTKNGRLAYQGEHSMLDAAPVITVIRRILKAGHGRLSKKFKDHGDVDEEYIKAGVSNVFEDCWKDPDLVQKIKTDAEKGRQYHEQVSNQFELDTVSFTDFGKKQVKQWGYDGPLMAQLAIQLAGYRLFGEVVGCYEAASTRAFLHGRTETTRPVSPETLAFVQAMSDETSSNAEKLKALDNAMSTIGAYQANAVDGRGVDRHLFGVSCMLENEEESPELFSDPLYQRAKTYRLSTSSVIFTPGFGPVHEKGLGVGFNAEKNSFTYIVTSRKANDYVKPFCSLLVEALKEIGGVIEAAQASER